MRELTKEEILEVIDLAFDKGLQLFSTYGGIGRPEYWEIADEKRKFATIYKGDILGAMIFLINYEVEEK
jgi:hypothetical protein